MYTIAVTVCNSYIANKRGFVQIIPPSWGPSYQFDWHAINRSRYDTPQFGGIICTNPSFSICIKLFCTTPYYILIISHRS